MPIYTIKLIDRYEVAKQTVVFVFEKPPGFSFKPGQYGGFTLLRPLSEMGVNGITRRFSLLSTPDDPNLSIAIRLQNSAYKHTLNTLPLGSEIKFAGPVGTFTLHEDKTVPAIFIAGGIGITPFYSIIRDAVFHRSPQSISLFYGNQTPKETAFFKELMQLQDSHPPFKLITTMAAADDTWQGERGFITDALIKKHVADLSIGIYYICGSLAMVNALQDTVIGLGISKDRIRVEDFPGY